MRVKLFCKADPMVESSHTFGGIQVSGKKALDLEAEINAWLTENPQIKIVDIKQSATGQTYTGSLWFITVWYEESA